MASPTGIDLSFFKWVAIVGVAVFVLFYIIKRVADFTVNKKTEAMIRDAAKPDRDGSRNVEPDESEGQ